MSRSEARELESRLIVLLVNLLKRRFQPDRRGRSWELTIVGQRNAIRRHLSENPGLKSRRDALLGEACAQARLDAAVDTDLPLETFPETNPFTWSQATSDDAWPEA